MQLAQIIYQIAQDSKSNPNLVVNIRADKDCKYDLVAQLLDGCKKYGITRYSLRTDPTLR
jgi:biopolymer transport protein ExbD